MWKGVEDKTKTGHGEGSDDNDIFTSALVGNCSSHSDQ